MPLFEIPCCERVISVGNIYRFGKKTEVMHVDGVGFFLHYDEEEQKNHDFIRKHLQQRVYGEAYVEAKNIHEALKKFYEDYEGAKVGGPEKREKARWINEKKFIHELPYCCLIRKNKKGQFICRDTVSDDDLGEYRRCVLEGFEAPEKCIMSLFRRRIRDYGRGELDRAAKIIDGLKFIELRTLSPF